MAAREDMTVRMEDFRQGETEAEEHGRPDNGVETQDVFADELDGGWPPVGNVGFWISKEGNVVRKSVDPNVHDLRIISRDRNAPAETLFRAGNRDVWSILEKIEDFLFAKIWENFHRVGFDGGANLVFEVGNTEIVVFLGEFFIGFLVVGADAVVFFYLFFGDETLTTFAIPTFVFGGIDVGGEFLPNRLAATLMVFVGGVDEVGRMNVEFFDEGFEESGVLSDIIFDVFPLVESFVEDFVAVFVGAGLETDFVATQNGIAVKNVGQEVVHGVADVWGAVDVWDCSGDISLCHECIL